MNRGSPALPEPIHKSRAFLRRPITRVSAVAAASVSMLFAGRAARAANTEYDVLNGQ